MLRLSLTITGKIVCVVIGLELALTVAEIIAECARYARSRKDKPATPDQPAVPTSRS